MEKQNTEKKRICLLDEVRGLCVLVMVLYHAYYVMSDFYGIEAGVRLFHFFMPLEPLFAGLFIIICGMSCTLSHSNLKRGLRTLAAGLAFSLVTVVILPRFGITGAEDYFGILHFLGTSILIYAALGRLTDKIPPKISVPLCFICFIFFYGIEQRTLGFGPLLSIRLPDGLYGTNYLMPLGIYSEGFASADYFPLLPFIFVFFAGTSLGRFFKENGYPAFFYKKRVPFLDFLGTKAFIIYLLHIPVTALLVFAVLKITELVR